MQSSGVAERSSKRPRLLASRAMPTDVSPTSAGGSVSANSVLFACEAYLAGLPHFVVPCFLSTPQSFLRSRSLSDTGHRSDGHGANASPRFFRVWTTSNEPKTAAFSLVDEGFLTALAHVFATASTPINLPQQCCEQSLSRWFPSLADITISHAWGGPLGVTRDWSPSVAYNTLSGVGHAYGFAGQGVAASNLAGRILADLVLGENSPNSHLQVVAHKSPRWGA